MTIMLNLSKRELNALIFAIKSDLETINNDIEEFAGEDELLLPVLQQLERIR